jgi:hypothetical protein
MKILKPTDPIDVKNPVFLIFGQPGIGKSSLGYSVKDGLSLDFDKGAHRAANRRDTLVIDAWADVAGLTTPGILTPYAALTVDTVGRCLDVMMADIILDNPKLARSGGDLNQQGWGALKTRFRTWTSTIRTLGKDLLLIAHDKEDKDGDVRVVRPDIVGGSYGEVMKIADFVGYLSMNGRQRVLDFSPTDRWVGKNPAGWAPFKVPPVAEAGAFMADLFDQGRKALGQISAESAAAVQVMDSWRAKIAAFTQVEHFNAAIPEIRSLGLPLYPQVAKVLVDRGLEIGLSFDAKAKAFTAPQPQPQLVNAGKPGMFD